MITPRWNWHIAAPVCGFLAAVGYTATNVCLRGVVHVDSAFVAAVRAIPTILLMLPIVLYRVGREDSIAIPPSQIGWLVGVGILTQIFGNVAFQWALGVIGLALSVSLVLGAMIIGSALIGWFVLREPLRPNTIFAIGLLLIAVAVLTLGAESVKGKSAVTDSPEPWWRISLAVLGNITAGIAYSALGTVMRRGMKLGMSVETTLLILSAVGLSVLGSWAWQRLGTEAILQTSTVDLQRMLAAGVLNALSFYMLAIALRHISVIYVHLINASQAAMAALAGWWIFQEAMTGYVIGGVTLTAFGLLAAGGGGLWPKKKPEEKIDSA